MSDDGRGLRFGTVAENYDQFRPAPPEDAASLVGDLRGLHVLDVGAGTGKLTRFLLRRGARVSVVEPDEAMRRVLRRRSPDALVLDGRAESVPVPDGSFDAVFSSSAWHWFAQPEATNEFARVLRDGGAINVWWNGFSRDVPWMVELTHLRQSAEDTNARARGWRAHFEDDGPFEEVTDFSLEWTWPRTIEDVVGVFSTYSAVIIQDDESRRALEVRVRDFLQAHFTTEVVALPMTLRGTSARRRPR